MNIGNSIPVFLSSIALAVSMSGFLALRSENIRLEEELTTVKKSIQDEEYKRHLFDKHLQSMILDWSPQDRLQIKRDLQAIR